MSACWHSGHASACCCFVRQYLGYVVVVAVVDLYVDILLPLGYVVGVGLGMWLVGALVCDQVGPDTGLGVGWPVLSFTVICTISIGVSPGNSLSPLSLLPGGVKLGTGVGVCSGAWPLGTQSPCHCTNAHMFSACEWFKPHTHTHCQPVQADRCVKTWVTLVSGL